MYTVYNKLFENVGSAPTPAEFARINGRTRGACVKLVKGVYRLNALYLVDEGRIEAQRWLTLQKLIHGLGSEKIGKILDKIKL